MTSCKSTIMAVSKGNESLATFRLVEHFFLSKLGRFCMFSLVFGLQNKPAILSEMTCGLSCDF